MPRKPPPSDAIPIFRFSTDAFPERERISAWREIFGRTVVNLDVEPLKADGFRAEATVCQLPGLGVLRASSAAVHLTHSRELIVDDDLSFMAAPTCPYAASQHGRDPVLDPGDGVLMDNAEVGSIRLASFSRFTTFRVPVTAIAPLVSDLGAAIARRIPAGNAALKLLVIEAASFSEFVLAQRLVRAHQMLTDPRCAGRPISAIAFDAGFTDLSHFNRTFRRRFGSTPSDVRARAQRTDE